MTYYVYGEGAIRHNGNPCEHGLGLDRHPLVIREDWPSRRAYLAAQISRWFTHRGMRLRGSPPNVYLTWQARLATRIFGSPWPHVPTAHAALRPEDSIYPSNREYH